MANGPAREPAHNALGPYAQSGRMHGTPFRLTPSDAERYARFRMRMLRESPWAFASSPEDDASLDIEHMARMLAEDQNAIFAVEARDLASDGTSTPDDARSRKDLIAAAGIFRRNQRKFSHRAKLWGVFVDTGRRGEGLGRAVVTAAVTAARGWDGVDYVDLGVSENAPEAQRLYEGLGFRAWGREPESLQHEDRRYDEIFMTLRL